MAATNFTPIILYHTTTASAAPTAGNLNNGELAINITDGKLFYKDNGGTVQVIATKGTGTIGGSNTQVQYNSSGALAGSANFTFNGTTATINTLNLTNALGTAYGGTALTTYTQGDLVYASAANTLAKLGIGANTYILTSTGSVPQWSAPSAVTVATATNLAGGAAGSVPYQSGASTTTFLSIGTQNQVLTSTGSAPQWSSGLTLTTLATTGNTTLGDAAADNLTVNATITSNLIFTDNTYDIGASGATRPRTIYAGTSIFSPLVDTTNLEVTNIKALDGTAAASIANGTGVISITANPVFSGGTANGVLYLNGSKVAASGSALTFDGTTFTHTGSSNFATSTGSVGVGTASPNGRLQVAGTFASQNNIVSITSTGVGTAATGAVRALYVNAQTANTASSVYGVFSEVTYTNSQTNYGGYFSAGDPSASSYGVYGLAAQTDVNGPGTAYGGYFKATAGATGNNGITYGARIENAGAVGNSAYGLTVSTVAGASTVVPFQVIHAGSEALRVDSSRNLLIGLSSALANGKFQVAGSIGLSGNTQIRQATNGDGNTLQVFATQFVAGSLNSTSYGYSGGGLIASVSASDSTTLFDAGRATSTDGRFKVLNTTSANTAISLEKNGAYTLYASTASGLVGIGTNSPTNTLSVLGTVGAGSSALTDAIYQRNQAVSGTYFTILHSGTGLTGTYPDTVTDATRGAHITMSSGDLTNDYAGVVMINAYGKAGSTLGNYIYFGRRTGVDTISESARFDSNGNLLIGGTGLTGSGDARLSVYSKGYYFWGSANGLGDFYVGNGSYGISMGVALGGGGAGTARIWTQNNGTQLLSLGVGNQDKLLIYQTQTIVQSSADALLTLSSSAGAFSSTLELQSSAAGSGTITTTQYLRFLTGGSERARISNAGEFLVGTQSSQVAGYNNFAENGADVQILLERVGTGAGFGGIGGSGANALNVYEGGAGTLTQRFYVTQAGACYNTTGTYGTISDIKIKENIQDARGYLEDLCRVRVVKYSLKSEAKSAPDKLGVIAQELEQIFPGMIYESPDVINGKEMPGTSTKTVKYSVFVPMLVKALQEQQAIIESLKARLDAANL